MGESVYVYSILDQIENIMKRQLFFILVSDLGECVCIANFKSYFAGAIEEK